MLLGYAAVELSFPDPSLLSHLCSKPRRQIRSAGTHCGTGCRRQPQAPAGDGPPVRWGARKLHVSGRCPAGLGPDWERLSQQPGLVRHTSPGVHRGLPPCGDSPHHREEDGSTAQQVDQKQRILPQAILRSPLLSGLYDDVGHVRQNLQDTRSG